VTIEKNIINRNAKNYSTRVPTVKAWNHVNMMTSHSLRAAVHEIVNVSRRMDVVKIGLVGDTGTGKSTLAESLAHLIHTISQAEKHVLWTYRIFGKKEYLRFREVVSALDPANYILYFHDLSFLKERDKLDEVKQAVTELRHMRQDVRIIMIIDYHYTKGLDKYLRQTNFKFFTEIGESEHDNLEEIVGKKNNRVVQQFIRQHRNATSNGQYVYKLGKEKQFIYEYRNPFAIALFWNQATVRHCIYPIRTWMAPVCMICNPDAKTEFDMEFLDAFHKRYHGRDRTVARLVLSSQGYNVYNKTDVAALNSFTKAFNEGKINAEMVMNFYGFNTPARPVQKS